MSQKTARHVDLTSLACSQSPQPVNVPAAPRGRPIAPPPPPSPTSSAASPSSPA